VPAAGIPVGLQPRSEPAGQKVNTGGITSATVIVRQQVTVPSVQITVTHISYDPQLDPELTEMDAPVFEPTIDAPDVLFVIAHWNAGVVHAVVNTDALI
jgi:hypothetical protein